MSEREARIVAEARAQVYGGPPGHQSDAIPALPLPVSGVTSTKSDAVSDAVRESMSYEPTGVMRSAANPLVRSAYAQAMREVETKTYDSGLWAMALVECNGDENNGAPGVHEGARVRPGVDARQGCRVNARGRARATR